jgi:hypothetical protein
MSCDIAQASVCSFASAQNLRRLRLQRDKQVVKSILKCACAVGIDGGGESDGGKKAVQLPPSTLMYLDTLFYWKHGLNVSVVQDVSYHAKQAVGDSLGAEHAIDKEHNLHPYFAGHY